MAGRRSARVLPLVLLCVLSVVSSLVSCSRGKSPAALGPAPAPADPRAQWYQLRDAAFQRIDGPGAAAPAERLPWTVQSRVADMAFCGDSLYCALNGSGLVRLDLGSGSPRFAYFPDALIFPYRTITTLVPRDGSIAVHLYYNVLLNTATPERLTLRGVSLVSFLPDREDYAFLIPPFQRKNPAWEGVGFAAVSAEEFLLEWKYSDPSETRFVYTRFFPAGKTEAPGTRDAYIRALAGSVESLPPSSARRRLLDACAAEVRRASPEASLLFTVRTAGSGPRKSFRSEGPATSMVSVAVFEEKAGSWALLPGSRLLVMRAGQPSAIVQLPGLPGSARFTDMVKAGGLLVLPWEEQFFTEVGAAGILLYSLES